MEGNDKDTHQRMFAMLSSLTWGGGEKKKKEVQRKNKSGLNIPHKAQTPWSCLCAVRVLGLI